jgi:NADH:ubiquinone oxidoreductase subunit E
MLSSKDIEVITRRHNYEELALMAVLEEIQEKNGFVPPYAMRAVSDTLDLPLSRVYAICSFYERFRVEQGGLHTITVCTGTSCSLCGDLLASIKQELNIEPGQTTTNKMFRLDTVRCLGCCAHSPIIKFDNILIANPDKKRVIKSLMAMVEGGKQ